MSDILDAASTKPREGGTTFSLRHRVFRGIWNVVSGRLGMWIPTPVHALLRWLACLSGAQADPTARIYPRIPIWNSGNLKLGDYANLSTDANCNFMALVCLEVHPIDPQGANPPDRMHCR
jgi:putative colanic acid biosynthesis acetyltransferase WcaF